LSEPDIDWYIQQNNRLIKEIEQLMDSHTLTNSMREIILHNTNEIEINFHVIMRKLREMHSVARYQKALRVIRDSLQRDEANRVYITDLKWFSQPYMSKTIVEWLDELAPDGIRPGSNQQTDARTKA
jgi:GTP-binding protein EngB required for normal cell division